MTGYTTTTEKATVVNGLEISITIKDVGAGERKADQVHMDIYERLGKLQAAYEAETPPDELESIPSEYVPTLTIAWDNVFTTTTEQ